MKAIRLVEVGAPVVERDIDIQAPAPGDVVIRVRAAGICHSDAHYRSGAAGVGEVPITLGHEVAGDISETGSAVEDLVAGDRVCIHYLVTCGSCSYCRRGAEQFCTQGRMIGKHRDGGWAEYITVPARSVVSLPEALSYEHAAILMCSSATAFHALRVCRVAAGEQVAILGAGGLGISAIQLASAMGAEVHAVDRRPDKLDLAAYYGASGLNSRSADIAGQLRERTGGKGVDVAIDFTGDPDIMSAAIRSLAPFGRLGLVAITRTPLEVDTYGDIIARELAIYGVSDHLMSELPVVLGLASRGVLDLSRVIGARIDLEATEINRVLDQLDSGTAPARTIIVVA